MNRTNTSKLSAVSAKYTKQAALIATTVISLSPVFFSTPAFAATTLEPGLVRQLQDARGQLLKREYQLLRDQDDLRKQIDDLKKRNDGNILNGTIDQLAKQLDRNYSDLRKTRTALRDIETNLL